MNEPTLERLQHLKDRFLDEKFRLNKTQVDVPYYVFPYEPMDELIVREFIKDLSENKSLSYDLKVFNLYDMVIEYLESRPGFLDKMQSFEEKGGMPLMLQKMSRLFKMDDAHNILTDQIIDSIDTEEQQIIILSGIGEVYPLIRAHNVMNTLANRTQEKPVVLMFPGEFENGYLKTFNELKDENYYRAIRLF